ncbi:hypothetical protein COL154_014142 [Colletotrichum chrysophilum]|nr:hypothetical protein COL154_014142 [Colletotrichum chrysophilum]
MSLDEQCRRFDAGFFPVMDFKHFHLEFPPLGPAGVHSEQHLRPVLALRAARTRMALQIGIVGTGLARKQCLDLTATNVGAQALQRLLGLCDDVVIASLLPKLDKSEIVVERRLELANGRDAILKLLALAHQLLGFGRIVPHIGAFGLVVQIIESFDSLIPVKDASSAGRSPA